MAGLVGEVLRSELCAYGQLQSRQRIGQSCLVGSAGGNESSASHEHGQRPQSVIHDNHR